MSVPAIPSGKNQDPRHVMNFPTLNLGHKSCSKKQLTMVDLDVHAYGLEEIKGGTRPVAVVIVSHGWANNAAQMENMAHGLVGEMRRLSAQHGAKRDVVVVTLDQRNHGTRKTKKDTLSYRNNPWRLTAMATTITGGVEDHQLLMSYLQSYLFPMNERVVDEYLLTGISLGGHVVWRLLREDPRVRTAVPIISIPPDSLQYVHTARFRQDKTLGTDKMYYPAQVQAFYETKDDFFVFKGKNILALHGSIDQVVPPSFGEESWAEVVKHAASTDKWVQADRGHIITPEMVDKTAEWLYRFGVKGDGERAKL